MPKSRGRWGAYGRWVLLGLITLYFIAVVIWANRDAHLPASSFLFPLLPVLIIWVVYVRRARREGTALWPEDERSLAITRQAEAMAYRVMFLVASLFLVWPIKGQRSGEIVAGFIMGAGGAGLGVSWFYYSRRL